jgi:hypothetical protein
MICSLAGAHRWSLFILTSLLVVATAGSLAQGQSLSIPPAAKTAPELDQTTKAGIEQKLIPAVNDLVTGAPDVQTRARQAIENETRIPGQTAPPSPAYLDVYAATLDKLLSNLPADASVRVRLNAAITAANVAQAAENAQLQNAILKFVNDKNDTVALWGIKGARFVIPPQLGGFAAPNPALVKSIVPAVKAHPEGPIAGAIASEAYNALSLDIYDTAKAKKINPKMVATIAPEVIALLEARRPMYAKGVPPSPRAEATGASFIAHPIVWKQLNGPQQLQTMQVLSDLVALAGQQAAAPAATPGDRADLAHMISRTAAAISVAADPTGAGAVAQALKPATLLGPQSTPQQIKTAVDAILPALKTVGAFAKLNNPPPVVGNEPAPPPASAPTTGPVEIPGAGNPPPPGAPTPTAPTPAPAPTPPRTTRPAGGAAPHPTPPPPHPPAGAGGAGHPPPPNNKPPAAR